MKKKYGKLTADQFRQFIDQLPAFQAMADELRQAMQEAPEERWTELLTQDFSWSWVYELPLSWHVALAIYAFNLKDWLVEVADSPDPQQMVLDDFQKELSDDFHPDIEVQEGLGLLISLIRNLQCILWHGRSLSALLHEVREDDNLDSLFKAIKLDRTVVNCLTAADRIAKAELQNDRMFFRRLSNAFKGPSQKEWVGLAGMKLSFHLLRDFEINGLTDDDLEYLLVHKLEVYKNVPGARKNLRMHYQNSRKLKTI